MSVGKSIGAVLMGIAIGALVVYLTPLKYAQFIEPVIDDVASVDFYEELQENPDQYLFIDVRGENSYNRTHAEGSINMPLHTFYDERHNLPKSGKEIVLICSGGRASGVAFSYLEHYGFTNIRRIGDGIEGWEASGLPVGSNIQPEALR